MKTRFNKDVRQTIAGDIRRLIAFAGGSSLISLWKGDASAIMFVTIIGGSLAAEALALLLLAIEVDDEP